MESGKGRKSVVYEVATLATVPERTSIDRRSLVGNPRAAAVNQETLRPNTSESLRPTSPEAKPRSTNKPVLEG